MASRLSPFFDVQYGWQRGEDGWNTGMDENLLKFSALQERNIKGFVTEIPVMDNGDVYINTTDARIYYSVNGTLYSTDAPVGVIYYVDNVGYLWDGVSAKEADFISEDDGDSRYVQHSEVGATGASVMAAETPLVGRQALGLGRAATQPLETFVQRASDSMLGVLSFAPTITLASAATTDIGSADSNSISITGSNTISGFGTASQGTVKFVQFLGNCTLVNSSSMLIPGTGNLVAQPGDTAIFESSGSGVWRTLSYTRYDGRALVESAGLVTSVSGRTGAVVLTKADVGLGNVDNTSDANKPISSAVNTALSQKAGINDPSFTGAPLAPTAATAENSNIIATTAFVKNALATARQFAHIQDQKASGTSGGASVAGSWQTRQLNTVVFNGLPGFALESNSVLLPAGRYYVEATVPFAGTNGSRARISLPSNGAILLTGTNSSTNQQATCITSSVAGEFTLLSPNTIQLQHYTSAAFSSGFGLPVASGNSEIYSEIRIWKLA